MIWTPEDRDGRTGTLLHQDTETPNSRDICEPLRQQRHPKHRSEADDQDGAGNQSPALKQVTIEKQISPIGGAPFQSKPSVRARTSLLHLFNRAQTRLLFARLSAWRRRRPGKYVVVRIDTGAFLTALIEQ